MRRLFWFCAMVMAISSAFAGPFSSLQGRLKQTTDPNDVLRLVRAHPEIASQPTIQETLSSQHNGTTIAGVASKLRTQLELGSLAERSKGADLRDQKLAEQIKQSALYRDQGIDHHRNWLGDALRRIRFPKPKQPKSGSGVNLGLLGQIFVFAVWAVLAAALIFLIYFAVRNINWRRGLRRSSELVLEDEEPLRTLDEWLQLADEHTAAGRYREAVRALYLACLMKFDENDVARFDRGETNWEHLTRIENSARMPAQLDFRTMTKRFDRVWYGHRTEGLPDVEFFRAFYQEAVIRLKEVPA